jgi:hypothetical protein
MLKNSLSAMLDFWEAYERGIQKISWGTSQFVDWAACAVLNRSKMVLSGDVPSNCSLASFRHARFFDFSTKSPQSRRPPARTGSARSGGQPTFPIATPMCRWLQNGH